MLTSFCTRGVQINTLGKANIHAIPYADIHNEKKFWTGPSALKVEMPEIINDIIVDKMNGNEIIFIIIALYCMISIQGYCKVISK
jgi:hypothetical protein